MNDLSPPVSSRVRYPDLSKSSSARAQRPKRIHLCLPHPSHRPVSLATLLVFVRSLVAAGREHVCQRVLVVLRLLERVPGHYERADIFVQHLFERGAPLLGGVAPDARVEREREVGRKRGTAPSSSSPSPSPISWYIPT